MGRSALRLCSIALLLVCGFACGNTRFELRLSRAELQEAVEKKFPYEAQLLIARFRLEDPRVSLTGSGIGVSVDFRGGALGKELTGTVDCTGEVVYRPESGAFYLSAFQLGQVTVGGVAFGANEPLNQWLTTAVLPHLNNLAVYRLDAEDTREKLARLLLKEVYVKDDALVLVLGT